EHPGDAHRGISPRRVHPAGRQYCRTRWDPPGRHRATGGFEHRRTGGTAPPEPARATGLDALVRRAVRHRAARDRDRLAVPGRGLAVVPAEVGYAAGWWVALQRGVAAVMIIGVEEGGELCEALGFAGVGARVGPFLFQGAVEPLDLAVGLGPVGAGAFVGDLLAQGG